MGFLKNLKELLFQNEIEKEFGFEISDESTYLKEKELLIADGLEKEALKKYKEEKIDIAIDCLKKAKKIFHNSPLETDSIDCHNRLIQFLKENNQNKEAEAEQEEFNLLFKNYYSDFDLDIINNLKMKFDLLKMHHDRGAYQPCEEQKGEIVLDILRINTFLKKANTLVDSVPNITVKKDSILFYSVVNSLNSREYCCFFVNKRTPTGKLPKYPLRLMFHSKKKIFGEIEYLQTMEIGKIWIVAWVQKTCYKFNVIMKNGELTLAKIEMDEILDGSPSKRVLYNIDNK